MSGPEQVLERMSRFDASAEERSAGSVIRYTPIVDGSVPSYVKVLRLWQADQEFRSFYSQLLSDAPFPAFRWETPALALSSADTPFEFVLIDAPHLATRRADTGPFSTYFTDNDQDVGIVAFDNLGGDATMVVPSPRGDERIYGHLADFVRLAPTQQVDALWKVIGRLARAGLSEKPMWINTEGAGVAWLHVRLDSRPKYYGHRPYRKVH